MAPVTLALVSYPEAHHKLLKGDPYVLKKHGTLTASRCSLWNKAEETTKHFFVTCQVAIWLWKIITLKLDRRGVHLGYRNL